MFRVLDPTGCRRLGPVGFEVVARKLAEICARRDPAFSPDDASLRTPGMVHGPRVPGHNQITDRCLLALAVAADRCLATLDHRVATNAIVGASDRRLLLLRASGSAAAHPSPSRRTGVSASARTSASTRIGLIT